MKWFGRKGPVGPISNEARISLFWVAITVLLLLIAYAITAEVAFVGPLEPSDVYKLELYTPEAVVRSVPSQLMRPLTLEMRPGRAGRVRFVAGLRDFICDECLKFSRMVIDRWSDPQCSWQGEAAGSQPSPVQSVGNEDNYAFDFPADTSKVFLICEMKDFIHAPSFRQRRVGFSINPNYYLDSYVPMPIVIDVSEFEEMTDAHFFVNHDTQQVDTRVYTVKPRDFVTIEWTSVPQIGREIYLLVLVGAVIALAATTLIEALRYWLVNLVNRLF
jgi:hypothetical protein